MWPCWCFQYSCQYLLFFKVFPLIFLLLFFWISIFFFFSFIDGPLVTRQTKCWPLSIPRCFLILSKPMFPVSSNFFLHPLSIRHSSHLCIVLLEQIILKCMVGFCHLHNMMIKLDILSQCSFMVVLRSLYLSFISFFYLYSCFFFMEQGAWNQGWSYRWNPQLFASSGFFVLCINFHGSTGYGQVLEFI